MRPQSIIMFERLFLASLVLSVLSFILTYDQIATQLDQDAAANQLGFGGAALSATMAASVAIYLLLWFLIARKASNIARWILVVFVALGLAFSLPAVVAGLWDASLISGLVVYALEVVAVVYLFRDDAKAWFAGQWHGDVSTFD